MSAAIRTLSRAVGERAAGTGPGPGRALVASVLTGAAVGVMTYKVLRSGS